MPVEYVIAHYNEDLTWLIPYADKAHVYHKGSSDGPPNDIPLRFWTKLDNVGREGHTYLIHIIENYDNLSDIIFFLQGRLSDHMEGKTLEQMLEETQEKSYSFLRTLLYTADRSHINSYWRDMFQLDPPKNVMFYPNGCFAVKKEVIHHYPKEFYLKIKKTLEYNSDPAEGHHVERMWFYMFDPTNSVFHN